MPEKVRTPTETLMAALESFGEDEPEDCIVVYTSQAGDLLYLSSTDSTSRKVGLLEAAKFWVLEGQKKHEDEKD